MLLKKRPLFEKFYDRFSGIFCCSRNIVNRNEYIYCYCHHCYCHCYCYCFSSQSCVLQFFFHIFQVVETAGLGDSFDTNMDATGRLTTQQPIKIIETYFATKSVLLTQWQCRRDFGRNNVPNRRTIQRLVAKFRESGSVADAPQRP